MLQYKNIYDLIYNMCNVNQLRYGISIMNLKYDFNFSLKIAACTCIYCVIFRLGVLSCMHERGHGRGRKHQFMTRVMNCFAHTIISRNEHPN